MYLTINKKGYPVLITRQNPNGGPALKGFPLEEDPQSGVWGYKLGYYICSCGCNSGEMVLIRRIDAAAVVAHFGISEEEYARIKKKIGDKVPLRHKIIKLLGGKVGE